MSEPGTGGPSLRVHYADIIFAASVSDPSGQNPKERRVVVLTPDAALAAGYPIVAAAVTGTIPPQLPADYVLLPYKNPPGTRHPKTGTTKKTAVVCTWLVEVNPGNVTGRSGFVPPALMKIIDSRTTRAAKLLGGWS
ncbi:hypothetical protein BH23PLA1_BH23PLA1_17520 [soil metagenome]